MSYHYQLNRLIPRWLCVMWKRSVMTILTNQRRIFTSLCSSPWLNRALKHTSSHCFHFLDHKLTAYCLLLTAYCLLRGLSDPISVFLNCDLDVFTSWSHVHKSSFFFPVESSRRSTENAQLGVLESPLEAQHFFNWDTYPQYPHGISTKVLHCKYLAHFADILCYLRIQEGWMSAQGEELALALAVDQWRTKDVWRVVVKKCKLHQMFVVAHQHAECHDIHDIHHKYIHDIFVVKRGYFTTFCQLERHTRGDFMIFYLLGGQPRERSYLT